MRQNIHSTFCNFALFFAYFIFCLQFLCLNYSLSEKDSWSENQFLLFKDGVHMCACVIISLVWEFFWSTGVLIESSGLSVDVQCCLHHSCNCHVRSLHTATVLFNWKLTFFHFSKTASCPRCLPPIVISLCLLQAAMFCYSQWSQLWWNINNLFLCLFPAFLYICVSVWFLVFTQDERT